MRPTPTIGPHGSAWRASTCEKSREQGSREQGTAFERCFVVPQPLRGKLYLPSLPFLPLLNLAAACLGWSPLWCRLWCASALAISSGERWLWLPRCRTSFAIELSVLFVSMDFSFFNGGRSICELSCKATGQVPSGLAEDSQQRGNDAMRQPGMFLSIRLGDPGRKSR